MSQFVLTKKIAKHGKQSIIIVPSILKDLLKPRTLVKVTIDILEEGEDGPIKNPFDYDIPIIEEVKK